MQDGPEFDSTQPVNEDELTDDERARIAEAMDRKHAADRLEIPNLDDHR